MLVALKARVRREAPKIYRLSFVSQRGSSSGRSVCSRTSQNILPYQ